MLVIDIFGDFTPRNHPYLPVIRELDRSLEVKINIMGPVHPSINHIQARKYISTDLALGIGTPAEFSGMHEGDYTIKMGVTSWETNKVPYGSSYGFKKILEDLDLLILPSKWQQRLFEHIKVRSTILNPPADSFAKYMPKHDGIFTYLCEGKLTYKSNVGYVLAAFLDIHRNRPDVRLVLKTESGTLGHLNFPYSNVKIIDQLYTSSQYMKLLADCDAFIYPTGADEPKTNVLNALIAGKMVIVPDHGGYSELSEAIRKVDIDGLVPATRYSKKLGEVGDLNKISYESLHHEMLNAWHNGDLPTDGKKISKYYYDRHNPKQIASDIIKLVRTVYDTTSTS